MGIRIAAAIAASLLLGVAPGGAQEEEEEEEVIQAAAPPAMPPEAAVCGGDMQEPCASGCHEGSGQMLGLCFSLDESGFPGFCGSYDSAIACDELTRTGLGLSGACARGMIEHAGFCYVRGAPFICGGPGRAVCSPEVQSRFGSGACEPGLQPSQGICAYGSEGVTPRGVGSVVCRAAIASQQNQLWLGRQLLSRIGGSDSRLLDRLREAAEQTLRREADLVRWLVQVRQQLDESGLLEEVDSLSQPGALCDAGLSQTVVRVRDVVLGAQTLATASALRWMQQPNRALSVGPGGGGNSVLGAGGGYGMAFAPFAASGTRWAGYLSGGLMVSNDPGASIGVNLGLWLRSAQGMAGPFIGVEGSVSFELADVPAGISATVFWSIPGADQMRRIVDGDLSSLLQTFQGIVITPALGIEPNPIGITGHLGYTVTFNPQSIASQLTGSNP